MKQYIHNRFYIRGYTLLGVFNTLTACITNRVLVLHRDSDINKIVGWHIGKGTDFPPQPEEKWTPVEERLPEVNFDLLLVLVEGSHIPALAVFTGKCWKVQPLFAKWFVADDSVTHWLRVPVPRPKRKRKTER